LCDEDDDKDEDIAIGDYCAMMEMKLKQLEVMKGTSRGRYCARIKVKS